MKYVSGYATAVIGTHYAVPHTSSVPGNIYFPTSIDPPPDKTDCIITVCLFCQYFNTGVFLSVVVVVVVVVG